MAKKDITVIGGDGWGYQTIPATGGGGEVFHDYTLVGKGTETDDLGVDVLPSDELTQSKVIDNLYAGMTISNWNCHKINICLDNAGNNMFLFKITFSATTFGFTTGEDVINFCQWHADFKDVPHMPFCANIVIPNTYTANDLRLIIDNSKWTLVKQPGSGTMNFQTNPLIVSVYFISLT